MVKPYFGVAASTYERRRRNKQLWKDEDRILLRILQEATAGSAVLDLPVGTGRFLPMFRECGLSVMGIDLSNDMLKIARSRASGDCRLERGDILNIPLGNASVDWSVCIRLLYFLSLEQVKVALRELARVTKDRVIFSARFTHRGGPQARRVITHDWEQFRKQLPRGWAVVRRHLVNDLASDEYLICEMTRSK